MTTLMRGAARIAAVLLTLAAALPTASSSVPPTDAAAPAPAPARDAAPARGREAAPRLAVDVPGSEDAEIGDEEEAAEARPSQVRVVLVNGGGSAAKNFLSHFHHLQDMVEALRARGIPPERIDVFSADGDDPGKDLAGREIEPAGFSIVEGTTAGRSLRPPDLTSSVWEGVTLRPARLRELRQWFAQTGHAMKPGDTLFLFVTDHGTRNAEDPDNGLISLWNETLSVLEYRALLGYLRPGVKVVNVMSQCYSGAFADAMAPLSGAFPGGDVCGFYSTTGDREAYGCYPEGRDKDRIGHAFRFIDMMGRHAALDDVHAAVLVTDTTPDVPVRTSDLFLERVLEREAGRRKVKLEEAVDAQLALAWKDRGRWEREIRLLDRIGEVYGMFSPRTLAELQARIDSLDALSKELDTYEDRWKVTLDDLRKENLAAFQASHPEWKDRLDEKKIPLLDPAARRKALGELIAALQEYTAAKPDVWARYQDLLSTDEDARSARYRADTRLAALLRMRTLLIRIAGEQLLGAAAGDDAPALPARLEAARQAFASLAQCEEQTIGAAPAASEIPPSREAIVPLPPFEEDLAAVRRALPSWLGIRFQPAPREAARRAPGRTRRGHRGAGLSGRPRHGGGDRTGGHPARSAGRAFHRAHADPRVDDDLGARQAARSRRPARRPDRADDRHARTVPDQGPRSAGASEGRGRGAAPRHAEARPRRSQAARGHQGPPPHGLLLGDVVRAVQDLGPRAPRLEPCERRSRGGGQRRGRGHSPQVPRDVDRPFPRDRRQRRAPAQLRDLRRQRHAQRSSSSTRRGASSGARSATVRRTA